MIQLDQWQQDVIDTEGDILLCTGRRVGKTYILSRKACERALKDKIKIVIVSLTEDQAMLIIQVMKDYLTEVAPKRIARGKDKPTLKTITLTNGSEVVSRPVGATGDSLRGYEADILVVDEASRMPKLFWLAAKPIVMRGGQIWLCSTPFGKQGYFWDKFNESQNLKLPESRFKVFYITSEDVITNRPISASWTEADREGSLKNIAEDKREMSILAFSQEYRGLFTEDLMQYFPQELIDRIPLIEKGRLLRRDNNTLGVDIARFGGDEITYEVLHKSSETSYVHVEHIVRKEQDTTKTEEQIIDVTAAWDCYKVGIDAGSGSLGVGIYDRLMKHDVLKYKVVAMNNRAISLSRDGSDKQRIFKEDMYDNLKNMFELGLITLLDDSNIRASLASVQYEIDEKSGRIRVFSNYGHIVEGLVRAAWLARKEKVNKFFIAYV